MMVVNGVESCAGSIEQRAKDIRSELRKLIYPYRGNLLVALVIFVNFAIL